MEIKQKQAIVFQGSRRRYFCPKACANAEASLFLDLHFKWENDGDWNWRQEERYQRVKKWLAKRMLKKLRANRAPLEGEA